MQVQWPPRPWSSVGGPGPADSVRPPGLRETESRETHGGPGSGGNGKEWLFKQTPGAIKHK